MNTAWWDDPRFFRTDGSQGGVPEEIPRQHWNEWDKMKIGGMDVPGHVVVFSKKEKKADVLSIAGQDGATINHLGIEPAEIDITITLWTPSQFLGYQRLLLLVRPRALNPKVLKNPIVAIGGPGAQLFQDPNVDQSLPTVEEGQATTIQGPISTDSFSVIYPGLNVDGVTAIFVTEIGSLVPGPVFGARVTVWRATEHKPSQPFIIHSSTGPYDDELKPVERRPTPNQPVTKPSRSGIGP